ncbi:MAG: PQQ-like beta-propeller repeat protein [Verrucomicrobia bacterium]|nr:PQQ-like beta-propeller repeat protein [Verrucomicrobiota bacterium]
MLGERTVGGYDWTRGAGIAIAGGVVLVTALLSLVSHLARTPPSGFTARTPGQDRAPTAIPAGESPLIHGRVGRGPAKPSALPGSWPGFRGARHDGIATTSARLAATWPAEGPRAVWRIDLGEGHAGAAVMDGCLYVIDYDRENQEDALRCLSLDDAAEIWRYTYPIAIKRNHGMSRTVPAVDHSVVVAMGPKCHVIALDRRTGERLWDMDLARDHGVTVPPWYAGQCPLLDESRVILATGGDDLMMAVDALTGDIAWRTPNPKAWKMTHSSIVPVHLGDRKIYLYSSSGGVVGVDARDGRILWETDAWTIRIAAIASPLPVGDGRIFFSGGYNAGSLMLQLVADGETITHRELFRLKAAQFGSTQQTPVFFEGHIYGVRPDGRLVCLDLDGKFAWESPTSQRFGLGPYMIVNDRLLAMDDHGLLTMARATPSSFRPLAQAQVLDGHDSWGPMASAERFLIVRDLTTMVCLDLGGDET